MYHNNIVISFLRPREVKVISIPKHLFFFFPRHCIVPILTWRITCVTKNKLNINDIQLTVLVDQYVEYIRTMQLQDMDVASEFIEMASRLIYLKTVSLLPKHDEAEQLKEENGKSVQPVPNGEWSVVNYN